MDEERPDPEVLLHAIMREERKNKGGRLKIFFGMSAGVGKTYTMLQQAQRLAKEGVDLVVGVINTHGRKETAELLKDLKVIPQKWIKYKDSAFEELDIDEILRIKPQLVLIDELAHTNVPGSRHPKRWQDVLEILDSSIDVYTTLNVQHIESRKEIVENITGIQIRETVPDLVLERAAGIELVDITPDELLQRLQEGKVYLGEQSRIAMQNFFKEHSLVALREIALRLTAEKIDHDLHGMHKEWRTRERLMVAISHSPHSQRLIRATRRLAFEMDALWIAVYVEMGIVLSNQDQANLVKNLNLARDLGAEVITFADIDLASGLQRLAKQKNISQILIGRPSKRKIGDYFKRNFIDQLIQDNSNIDIVVLRQDIVSGLYLKTFPIRKKMSPLSDYGIASLGTVIATILGYIALPWLGYQGIGIVFMVNILFLSFFVGRGPIFIAAILNGLFWNFLFIPPLWNLKIDKMEDAGFLIIYLLVAVVMGVLSSRVIEKERLLSIREENSEFLFEIEKEIANASSIQHLRIAIINRLKKIFKGDFDILVKNNDNQLVFDGSLPLMKDEKERVVALWVFKNDKIAGWSTDTLPYSAGLFFPIRGFGETMGVLIFQPKYPRPLTISEMNLIQTVNQQVGVYVQRALAKEKARSNEYIHEVEKAQDAIFHSFSYNINIPLMLISSNIEELKMRVRDEDQNVDLIKQAEKNLNYLKELLSNVLTMSKLSSGFMHFVKVKQDVRELIETVIEKFENLPEQRAMHVTLPKHFPLIALDRQLLMIALNNLIINALEYSPYPKPIMIKLEARDNEIVISILDEGPGIPSNILPHIFDKFYQAEVPGAESTGLGLGLAVTRAIVEIHQGKLEAYNRLTGGAEFLIILPL